MRLEQLTRNPPATFPAVLHDLSQKLGGMDPIVNREIHLRGYQTDCIDKIAHSYGSGHRAPILQLVTGAGKTVIFADITRRASLKGTTTLVLAHRVELIRQASAKLGDAGVEHGIIGPQFEPSPEHSVQVGSVQTVVRRLDSMPKFGLIILDESHHATSPTYRKILESQPQARILGVTATPERLDGKGLGIQGGGPFDDLIVGPPVDELIAGGFLTPARVFAPAHGPDLRSVRTRAGDYARDDLAGAMGQPSIIGDAVEHYRRHADGLAAIAFCVSVDHGQETAQAFRSAGYRSVCVHGEMPADERDLAIGGLATGEIEVLTSCDLVSEGLDVPAVGAVILLRPTKSLGLYLQMVGRGLRPAHGKSQLVILDHAGNVSQHGFVEDARQWSLSGREKRSVGRKMSITRCSKCGALHKTAPKCPECGFVHHNPRQVNAIDGELTEMRRIQHPQSDWRGLIDKNLLRTAPLQSILTGKDSRERLELIRQLRGYKAGWVYYMLRQQQEQRASARSARSAA